MDLGFPEEDSKLLVPTSSEDNYFSQQAFRAGLIANDLRRPELMMNSELRRPELMMNSDPLRESMQREWEKERIREQIIASEIMRRRELEAEVRRELAMERELALRRGDGFSLSPPVLCSSLWSEPRWSESNLSTLPFQARTGSGPIERLPFQRDPEAAKMAAKPITANLAGIKRKVSDVIGTNVPNATSSKKKAQDWSCALCQVSATCEYGLSMHLKGRKHKAKEARLNEEAAKSTGNSSLGKKTNNRSSKKNKKIEAQAKKKLITPDTKRQFPFWCEDCQIGCHSEVVLDNHIKGKKHIARTKELKLTDGFVSSTIKSHEAIHKEDAFEEAIVDVKEDIDIEMDGEEVETERPEVKENIVREVGEWQGVATETMESLVDVVAVAEASKDVQQEAAAIIDSLAVEKEVETDGLEVKENILREDGEEEHEKEVETDGLEVIENILREVGEEVLEKEVETDGLEVNENSIRVDGEEELEKEIETDGLEVKENILREDGEEELEKEVETDGLEVKENILREDGEEELEKEVETDGLEVNENSVIVDGEEELEKEIETDGLEVKENILSEDGEEEVEKEVETDGLEVKENILREDSKEELEKKGQEEAIEL